MKINIIAAIGQNNELGKNNKLLTHLPKDLQYFKNKTWGLPIIMGRKTFQSLQYKPLQGRNNIVITHNLNNPDLPQEADFYPLLSYAKSIEQALEIAKKQQTKEVYIIGGEATYKAFMPLSSSLYITKIKHSFDGADAFFPPINPQEWQLVSWQNNTPDDKNPLHFDFEIWQRIK